MHTNHSVVAADTANPARVSINDSAYFTAHGRAPRGRGCWAFCPAEHWNSVDYLDHVIWVTSAPTFGKAKAEARRIAAARGVDSLVVCS